MGRMSLELVPRCKESFTEELSTVKKDFPCIDTLNIPDILKFDMRIPEACEVAVPFFNNVIPHLRAVAENKEEPLPFKDFFESNDINEVLVILGDNPEIVSQSDNPCDSIDLIKKIKEEMPGVTVYAGVDQWRTTFEEEMEYVHRKIEAGADGFFTQPFFDTGHIEKWAGALKNSHVFWGLAPVVRESSKHYWESKNKVIFPQNFKCTLDWNQKLAKDTLHVANTDKSHVYFCPITIDFVEYLTGIV